MYSRFHFCDLLIINTTLLVVIKKSLIILLFKALGFLLSSAVRVQLSQAYKKERSDERPDQVSFTYKSDVLSVSKGFSIERAAVIWVTQESISGLESSFN